MPLVRSSAVDGPGGICSFTNDPTPQIEIGVAYTGTGSSATINGVDDGDGYPVTLVDNDVLEVIAPGTGYTAGSNQAVSNSDSSSTATPTIDITVDGDGGILTAAVGTTVGTNVHYGDVFSVTANGAGPAGSGGLVRVPFNT